MGWKLDQIQRKEQAKRIKELAGTAKLSLSNVNIQQALDSV